MLMRKWHYASFLIFALFPLILMAQSDSKRDSTAFICVFNPEPEFPGGKEAFTLFLSDNLRLPKKHRVNGKILVAFIVSEDGSISDTRIVRTFDTALNKRILKVFNSMPRWTFPKDQGKIVKVSYAATVILSNGKLQPLR